VRLARAVRLDLQLAKQFLYGHGKDDFSVNGFTADSPLPIIHRTNPSVKPKAKKLSIFAPRPNKDWPLFHGPNPSVVHPRRAEE
jgi:hypothetical protein